MKKRVITGSEQVYQGELGQSDQLDGFQKIDMSVLNSPMVDIISTVRCTD